jgi:serine/threonine protein kinase
MYGTSKGLTGAMVKKEYLKVRVLGNGADGVVTKWIHKDSGHCIAIKTVISSERHSYSTAALSTEIIWANRIQCEQIVSLLGFDEHWDPPPAAFLEYCDLGDAYHYAKKIRKDYGILPEQTVWKFFADVVKGLDYLHSNSLIHGDLKPENVMVCKPRGSQIGPHFMPDFKIGDLSRCVTYPPQHSDEWGGTWEFAPPVEEREIRNMTPAVDIFALGASIQQLALDRYPVMSWEKFQAEYDKKYGRYVKWGIQDRAAHMWREQIPVYYRPLNVHTVELCDKWDFPVEKFQVKPQRRPFSDALNAWYTCCWTEDPSERSTAAELVKYFLPKAEEQLAIYGTKREVVQKVDNVDEAKRSVVRPNFSSGQQSSTNRPKSHHQPFSFEPTCTPPSNQHLEVDKLFGALGEQFKCMTIEDSEAPQPRSRNPRLFPSDSTL